MLMMAKQVELSVRCVVKGYHECPFYVNIGETFHAFKKRGERGNAFKVCNDRGQLGHIINAAYLSIATGFEHYINTMLDLVLALQ